MIASVLINWISKVGFKREQVLITHASQPYENQGCRVATKADDAFRIQRQEDQKQFHLCVVQEIQPHLLLIESKSTQHGFSLHHYSGCKQDRGRTLEE